MSFHNKLNNSDAAKGNLWQSRIFYIHDTKKPTEVYTGEEMMKLINAAEMIEDIWLCKEPLTSIQLTDLIFYHAFVVIKTKTCYYSFEKNGEGIHIQRSDSRDDVLNNVRGEARRKVTILKQGRSNKNIGAILYWIISNELDKGYYLTNLKNNCQGFASLVYTNVTTDQVGEGIFA